MKEKIVAVLIGLVLFVVPVICLASHEITYFRNNKAGAVSITFDDGYKSWLTNGAVTALNARDLKATFFVVCSDSYTSESSHLNWDELRTIAGYGHEIASHTMTHAHLPTLNDSGMLWELSESKNTIDQNIPSQSCVSLSYPYGEENAKVQSAASNYYIAGRGTWADEGGFLNHYRAGSDMYGSWQQVNFYNTGSYGFGEPYNPNDSYFNALLAAAISRPAWLSVHFHDINDSQGFVRLLDHLLTKDLWIGTYGNIVQYMRERLFSTLTVISETSSEIRLHLANSLDPALYNFPLTIRSTVPSFWTQVQITQGSTPVTVTPVVEGSETVVYYDAVPNGGDITLNGGGADNPVPVLTDITPTSVLLGSGNFMLTVYGSNFVTGAVVRWNGADRMTTYVSSTQLSAAIPASDVAAAGTAQVTVFNPTPGGGTSSARTFTVNNPVPATSSLSPSSAAVGGQAFTLTVNGSGFVTSSVVRWNGANRTTTYISSTQLTAAISASDIAVAGTASVTVFNPSPGGGISNAQIFTINSPDNPVPTTSSLSPMSATAGGAAFTLTVNGSGFVTGSVVRWNGGNRTTTYVSSTQLTAAIPALDIAVAGTAQVTVFNPTPGGGTSNAQIFTINTTVPGPCGTVITWEGRVGASSDDAEELLTSGAMYLDSTDLELINDQAYRGGDQIVGIRFRGVDIPQGATILSAYIQFKVDETSSEATSLRIVGEDVDNAGTFGSATWNISSRVRTGAETLWSPVAWTIVGEAGLNQRTPDISSIINEIINRGGWSRGNSIVIIITGTGKRVAVAYDGDQNGAPLLHVEYSTKCSGDNPVPAITGLSPSSATAGGAAFTLTVNGGGFVTSSVVRWNGADRTTTYVSSTQLTVAILASDIATAGTASVTVFNPSPGGGTSNAQTFTINTPSNPVPTTTGLSPASATTGGVAVSLTVSGTNFVSGSMVYWNGSDRTTTYVSATQLTASISAADIATAGTASVTVFNPSPGGGTSNAQIFTINSPDNPVPTTTNLNPSSAIAGGSGFNLTVSGTNFVSGSMVYWNGSDRTTTYVSATQLTASISAADIATAGTASVTVFNPSPGGGTSNGQTFTINASGNPLPTISSLSPSLSVARRPSFTLTVNGSNFVKDSVVRWNSSDRVTTFVSVTQLTAAISEADIAVSGTVLVIVFNRAPGGGTSNARTFTITDPPVPTTSSVSPSSCVARTPGLTLTVNGSNFVTNSVVQWNRVGRSTTFVSATKLTAEIPASEIALAGTVQVTVFTPSPGGGTSNARTLTINNPGVPKISSLSPALANAGGAMFTLTVNGNRFVTDSVVRWNGTDRPTTFVSSTQLTAAISAADIVTVGTAQVRVFTPLPGGGISSAKTFTIN